MVAMKEEPPQIKKMECRICQEEDEIENMEMPCACSGTLKYAHRICVQRWCDEKGDTNCEICREPYRPGYTAPPPPPSNETVIEISDEWQNTDTNPLDLHVARVLEMTPAERHLMETEYDNSASTNASTADVWCFAVLILMSLLLFLHAMTIPSGDGDGGGVPTILSIFLLRAVGFLLPCYVMAWAVSSLWNRRQRQIPNDFVAARMLFLLRSGRGREPALFRRTSDSPTSPRHQTFSIPASVCLQLRHATASTNSPSDGDHHEVYQAA